MIGKRLAKTALFATSTVLSCAFLDINPIQATTISFSDFSDISSLTLNEDASQDGNRLLLAPAVANQTGSAFLTNPFTIGANTSFQTRFEFQITESGGAGGGADGFIFMLQNDSRGANAIGGGGGNIGYGDTVTPLGGSAILSSLAIEFDTFDNGFVDPSASADNHIGINTNGSVDSLLTAGSPVDLNDGNSYNAWISYDGIADQLEVFLDEGATPPATPLLSTTVDLFDLLGPQGFVGFSAATGGGVGNHEILNWDLAIFESTSVSEPLSFNIVGELGSSSVPEYNETPFTGVLTYSGQARDTNPDPLQGSFPIENFFLEVFLNNGQSATIDLDEDSLASLELGSVRYGVTNARGINESSCFTSETEPFSTNFSLTFDDAVSNPNVPREQGATLFANGLLTLTCDDGSTASINVTSATVTPAQSVPEPGTTAGGLASLLGLGWLLRRKRVAGD
jgi:hypothetical protein